MNLHVIAHCVFVVSNDSDSLPKITASIATNAMAIDRQAVQTRF